MPQTFFDELYEASNYKSRACFDKVIKPFESALVDIASQTLDVHTANYIVGICNHMSAVIADREANVIIASIRKVMQHKICAGLASLAHDAGVD